MSTPSLAQPADELGHQLANANAQAAAACARSMQLQQRNQQVLTEAQAIRQIIADTRRQQRSTPAGRELPQLSQYERLLARLATMPVIEQAKGIIIAQSHCGEAEAFDMLRRASQRSNVPVRDLATQIVAKATRTAPPTAAPDRQGRTSRHPGARPRAK